MMRGTYARISSQVMGSVTWLCVLLIAVLSAAIKVDASQYKNWPLLLKTILWLRNTAWISLFGLTITAAGLNELRARIGSNARWQTVQLIVDQYHDQLFDKVEGPVHHHNVTLYKFVRWHVWFCRWPWSGWVQPVIRSGHRTKKGIPWFRASLEHPEQAKGIAGTTFSSDQQVKRENLPDLDTANVTEEQLNDYAGKTYVTRTWLGKRSRRPNARFYWGIPIEVSGKTWGALVIDSRSTTVSPSKQTLKTLVILQEMLGKVLDKG